jgi:hypothetical protein
MCSCVVVCADLELILFILSAVIVVAVKVYTDLVFISIYLRQHDTLIQYSGSLLRHYATSWKVAGSIPDEVIGFLN